MNYIEIFGQAAPISFNNPSPISIIRRVYELVNSVCTYIIIIDLGAVIVNEFIIPLLCLKFFINDIRVGILLRCYF